MCLHTCIGVLIDSCAGDDDEYYDLFRGDGEGAGEGAELQYSGFFDPLPPSTHSRKEKKVKHIHTH